MLTLKESVNLSKKALKTKQLVQSSNALKLGMLNKEDFLAMWDNIANEKQANEPQHDPQKPAMKAATPRNHNSLIKQISTKAIFLKNSSSLQSPQMINSNEVSP